MESNFEKITINAEIDASVEKVWEMWNSPEHIVNWNATSEDWQTTRASNELKIGGSSSCRMEAKDGSMGFDFNWIYTAVESNKHLEYTLEDNRKVVIDFSEENGKVNIIQTFDAETENTMELQKLGWQSILNNFKKYVENN
jgi:uncharacterized protein YndB with AHSA1/START domain